MLGARRAVDEIPRPKVAFLGLDEQQAFAGEDEEVLLVGLSVIKAARLSGRDHRQRESHVGEGRRVVALEGAGRAEHLAREPRRLQDVDHESAVADRRQARVRPLHARFLDDPAHSRRSRRRSTRDSRDRLALFRSR
jgi:hypothetical protein